MECILNEITETVTDKMCDVLVELCNGCRIDHPSQKQHDLCLMATDEERLERTFWAAWSCLKSDQLYERLGEVIYTRVKALDKYKTVGKYVYYLKQFYSPSTLKL